MANQQLIQSPNGLGMRKDSHMVGIHADDGGGAILIGHSLLTGKAHRTIGVFRTQEILAGNGKEKDVLCALRKRIVEKAGEEWTPRNHIVPRRNDNRNVFHVPGC